MTKPFTFLLIVLKQKINLRSTKKGEASSPILKMFVERNTKNNKVLTHGEKQKFTAEECQSFEDCTQSRTYLNVKMNAFKIQVRKGVQLSLKGIAT